MDIKLINKIEDKVNEYIDATGSNKTWIAKQIGLSKQALYNLLLIYAKDKNKVNVH